MIVKTPSCPMSPRFRQVFMWVLNRNVYCSPGTEALAKWLSVLKSQQWHPWGSSILPPCSTCLMATYGLVLPLAVSFPLCSHILRILLSFNFLLMLLDNPCVKILHITPCSLWRKSATEIQQINDNSCLVFKELLSRTTSYSNVAMKPKVFMTPAYKLIQTIL